MSRYTFKRRQSLKLIILALTISLGFKLTSDIGTFALFKDSEDIKSALSISTGDIDIEIKDNIESITAELKAWNESEGDGDDSHNDNDEFVTKNVGTLNQRVFLQFLNAQIKGGKEEDLKNINFEIEFECEQTKQKLESEELESELKKNLSFIYNSAKNKKLFSVNNFKYNIEGDFKNFLLKPGNGFEIELDVQDTIYFDFLFDIKVIVVQQGVDIKNVSDIIENGLFYDEKIVHCIATPLKQLNENIEKIEKVETEVSDKNNLELHEEVKEEIKEDVGDKLGEEVKEEVKEETKEEVKEDVGVEIEEETEEVEGEIEEVEGEETGENIKGEEVEGEIQEGLKGEVEENSQLENETSENKTSENENSKEEGKRNKIENEFLISKNEDLEEETLDSTED